MSTLQARHRKNEKGGHPNQGPELGRERISLTQRNDSNLKPEIRAGKRLGSRMWISQAAKQGLAMSISAWKLSQALF